MTEENTAASEPVGPVAGDLIGDVADPFEDLEDVATKNFGKVGSVRPTALLYTSGIGATVDLPHLAVMPQGLDAWEHAYKLAKPRRVQVPRLLEAVRSQLGPQVSELRQPPWVAEQKFDGGPSIGIPTRVFPQWMRCTGCDLVAPVSQSNEFVFKNTSKFRPDKAGYFHKGCKGRPKKEQTVGSLKARDRPAVPARYMIACVNGHLDEFPYVEWVHGAKGSTWVCSKGDAVPKLRMIEWRSDLGPQVRIKCVACGSTRNLAELTRAGGANRLPMCRGRHPHLPTYRPDADPCNAEVKLMLLGASNQWFPATIGVLVLPTRKEVGFGDIAEMVNALPPDEVGKMQSADHVPMWRAMASADLTAMFEGISNELLWQAIEVVRGTAAPSESQVRSYDPNLLLSPEWDALTHPEQFAADDKKSEFRVRSEAVADSLAPRVSAVVAVERLKKANAFIGFTRIDALDRIGDDPSRLAPLAINGRPTWVPATEDRGEGVFLEFEESVIAPWESTVESSAAWAAHVAAHERNFARRQSATAAEITASDRMPSPRYWAIHTLAHLLIREMAMSSGYGSASLTERVYAWKAGDGHAAAAGLLISTTSPDSEGTLGGLVELARTEKLSGIVERALARAQRCSSDPICAHRLPKGQEDFLHGAACHFCLFVSETSCEKANRFLDRRFVLTLNAGQELAVDGLFEPLTVPADM